LLAPNGALGFPARADDESVDRFPLMPLAWTVFPGAKSRFRKIEFHERRQRQAVLSGSAPEYFHLRKSEDVLFFPPSRTR
jgi:hypothetical protein